MSFGRYLHQLSCALILLGFSSVLITGSYQLVCLLGVGVTLFYLFSPKTFEFFENIPVSIWNTLVLLLLAYFIYDSFYGSLDLVGNAITFVIVLQIIKLGSAKTNRDWMQIYALSFLHVISSTVISDNITFAIPFVFYLFVACWTLAIFNIKDQYEKVYSEQPTKLDFLLRSRHLVGRSFFSITAALCSGLLVVTMFIFFSIPRVSFKQFLRRAASQQDVSGFSDEVELGSIGSIKDDNTVAFRVEISQDLLEYVSIEDLYWRGTSADIFDGRKWSRSQKNKKRVNMNYSDPTLDTDIAPLPGERSFTYRVFMESLSTPILFSADRVLRFHWEKSFIERLIRRSFVLMKQPEYGNIELVNQERFVSDLTYTAESSLGERPTQRLIGASQDYPVSIAQQYLQLPPLHPSVKSFFEGLNIPDVGPFEKAVWLIQYLKQNYSYSTDVQDKNVADPMRHFFLRSKKGHCEYFSTAFIVMLRYSGVPARQVMGYHSGELNNYGNYIAVRQSDAHSWAEIYFNGLGWVRFDPTPPDHLFRFSSNLLRPIRQFIDYARLRWNKYIVEYNLKTQISGLMQIGQFFKQLNPFKKTISGNAEFEVDDAAATPKKKTRYLLVYILGVMMILVFIGILRKFGLRRSKTHLYMPVLKVLKKRGIVIEASMTPEEMRVMISEKDPDLAEALLTLNHVFYAHRFGQKASAREWKESLGGFYRQIKGAKSG